MDNISERFELVAISPDIEPHLGTTADDRQCFAARWDVAHLHRFSFITGLRGCKPMADECGAHAGSKPQEAHTRQTLRL